MVFDLVVQWLQDAIIQRNSDGLDFLQATQCAFASGLDDRFGTCLPLCGHNSWVQFEWVPFGMNHANIF